MAGTRERVGFSILTLLCNYPAPGSRIIYTTDNVSGGIIHE